MEEYMSFKQSIRGFDKDEVMEYIRKQEEEFNQRLMAMEKEIRKRDKIISELKNRIVMKDDQVEHMERDIRNKYQKYIDHYRQIGDILYESKMKGQRIVDDANDEASRIIGNAESEAQKRILSVQGQIDRKLTDGKRKYLAVQDEMNEIVEMFNQMQRKFMVSYKEVHEIIQSMPSSLSDMRSEPESAGMHYYDEDSADDDFDIGPFGMYGKMDELDDDPDEDAGANFGDTVTYSIIKEKAPVSDDIEGTDELAKLDGASATDIERHKS
ncbi:MAG: hypothetical protein Q4G47_00510 [Lachnospiraceae bacterium]|nr:hypothetical protein [Lachnospiraceae bacterium]